MGRYLGAPPPASFHPPGTAHTLDARSTMGRFSAGRLSGPTQVIVESFSSLPSLDLVGQSVEVRVQPVK